MLILRVRWVALNKILTANLSNARNYSRRAKTRCLYASYGDMSPSCTWVPLFTIFSWYMYMRGRVMDGRARIPCVRSPFEFARCTRRIKYQNSISSGIAILRDSPMVLLLPLRATPFPLPLSIFYIGECARRCIISTWMRVRAGLPAGWAEIYVVLLSGKTTDCCRHDAHLQLENSLKMSLPIAPTVAVTAAVDHRAAWTGAPGFPQTMTGTSDPIRTSPARSGWAIAS